MTMLCASASVARFIGIALLVGNVQLVAQRFVEANRTALELECGEIQDFFIADLNGDLVLDVVMSNGSVWDFGRSPYPVLALHGDGRGRWGTPTREPACIALGVADLDGDGDIDILSDSGVLANDGTGQMTYLGGAGFPILTDYPGVVADFTGDGQADLIGLGGLEFHTNQGNLSFVDETALRMPGFAVYQAGVALDADGDGDLDLFATGANGADLLLNQNGFFAVATAGALPPSASAGTADVVEAADLDGDGDADLVVAGPMQTPRIYENDGSGTYVEIMPTGLPTMDARSLAIGDVDGDGDHDLLFGELLGGRLLLAVGGGYLPAPNNFDARGFTSDAIALADMDGDGDLDLLQGCRQARGTGLSPFPGRTSLPGLEPRLLWNDGSGTFFDSARTDIPARSNDALAAIGDLDGDGTPDAVFGDVPGVILRNRGDATFLATPVGFPAAGTPMLGDLDGDGDLDCVLLSPDGRFWSFENSGGTLALLQGPFQVLIPSPWEATDGQLGDVDGDGRLDLVVGTGLRSGGFGPAGANEALWLGANGGTFVDASSWFQQPTNVQSLALGDLDGDGDLDAMARRGHYENTGTGFVYTAAPNAYDAGYAQVALADLDGDSDLDAIAATHCVAACGPSNDEPSCSVTYNDGSGTFGPWLALPGTQYKRTLSLATGDVDGDGDTDIVFGNDGASDRSDHNQVLYGQGGAFPSQPSVWEDLQFDFEWTSQILLEDLDRDGDLDLFAINRSRDLAGTPRTKLYRNMTRQLVAPYAPRLGRNYSLELHGSPAGGGLWLSLQGANAALPPYGTLGLGPGMTPLALLGPPTGAAVARLDLLLPATSALAGQTVFLQAIDAASLRLSNTLREQLVAW